MADADCCMLCCCCCTLLSLCNTGTTHPFCFPRVFCCPRFRRSKFDDDRFIEEVLRENEAPKPTGSEHPLGDPKASYHIKQPEPIAQMGIQLPTRSLSQQRQSVREPQLSIRESQPQHTRAESDGTNEEGRGV